MPRKGIRKRFCLKKYHWRPKPKPLPQHLSNHRYFKRQIGSNYGATVAKPMCTVKCSALDDTQTFNVECNENSSEICEEKLVDFTLPFKVEYSENN